MAHDVITEGIGLIAALLTTSSFCPQVVKVWQTRDVRAISANMYIMFTMGTAAWLIYGIMIRSPSIIAANAASFCLAATILMLKRKYSDSTQTLSGRRDRKTNRSKNNSH